MTFREKFKTKYIGSPAFFSVTLKVAVPILVSQLITTFVNMLDNIMVGQVGTLAMSGVAIANQLIQVFYISVFGTISAASIFGAQYYGRGDTEGVRRCMRFKILFETLFAVAGMFIYWFFGEKLVSLFLNPETNTPENITAVSRCAVQYIRILTISFIPFALTNAYASGFREAGDTKAPMYASMFAVAANFLGNLILIFGYLGAPALGSEGAAIATVISRFIETAVILWAADASRDKLSFFTDIFHPFHIPSSLARNILVKGLPLIVNEILWSVGITAISQCYSTRGIDAVAAVNIETTIENLFQVFTIAMGNTTGILVGQKLGAGRNDEAVDMDNKLIFFGFAVSLLLGLILVCTADLFPLLYNTTDSIRHEAAVLLRITGATLWIGSIYNSAYFTLRSGGKTFLTFLFDSVGTIGVSFPIAFVLSRFTSLSLPVIFAVVHLVGLYKVILGLWLIHKGVWLNNLTEAQ